MAIRVRKLAKELDKEAAEVLGVLAAIGITRYRSPEDMLSGSIEAKVRSAVRSGVQALPVVPEAVRKAPIAAPPPPKPTQEALLTAPKRAVRAAAPLPVPPEAAPTPVAVPPPAPSTSTAEVTALIEALGAERRALAELRESLTRPAPAAPQAAPEPSSVPLSELLTRRGLVGQDEAERAIRTLAEKRRLVELLPYLRVTDPAHVGDWLAEVLLLVDGAPPEALQSQAVVSVAPERAEVPNAAAFRRQASQISEQLMLNGARRVVVVGGPIRWHRLLARALDPRIEIRFRPTTRVGVHDAEADVSRTDAIVLWDVVVDADAEAVYRQGAAIVAIVQGDRLDSLFRQWARALAG